jgi:Holliday junction resolvase RusA-like endonuclease
VSAFLVEFRVAGLPQPQGSKTIGRTRTGNTYLREDNPHLRSWRADVAVAALDAMTVGDDIRRQAPHPGPVRLEATFVFPRPRHHYRTGRNAGQLRPSAPIHCDKRPDLDKLVRALGDALTGIVLVDDAQVAELAASKCYGAPGCHVKLERLA